MIVRVAFLVVLIYGYASPVQATFEEDEVAYILFGVNKKGREDEALKSNSPQGGSLTEGESISVLRREECIYEVEYNERAKHSKAYIPRSYYVDLSDLKRVEIVKKPASKRPRVMLIGGHIGCPVKMRDAVYGCATELIGAVHVEDLNRSARGFSDRFCSDRGTKSTT